MKEFNIVLASNDGSLLTAKHFGDSEIFCFYKIFEDGTIDKGKVIENKFIRVDESTAHGSKEKRQSIISYLGGDIDFIVAGRISPNFKKISSKTKVCPIVSKIQNIEELLNYLKTRFNLLVETQKNQQENHKNEILIITGE
jgi:predicted Fe-Mo cluster-binding NifX family protein